MSTFERRFRLFVALVVVVIGVLAVYLLVRPSTPTQFKLDVETMRVTVESEVQPVEGPGSTEADVRERYKELVVVLDTELGVKLEANWYAEPMKSYPSWPADLRQSEIPFKYKLYREGVVVFTGFDFEGVIDLKNGTIQMTEQMRESGGDRRSSHFVSVEAKLVPIN